MIKLGKIKHKASIATVAFLRLLFLSLTSPLIYADFISLTGAETAPNIAEIKISKNKLLITLEVSATDADKFWPGITLSKSIYELARSAKKQQSFALELHTPKERIEPDSLSIRIAERKTRSYPFAGKVDPRTGSRMPDLPADKIILLTKLEFPIEGLDKLELRPPLGSNGMTSVTLGFTSRHGQTPISDFHYLSQPELLTIDWKDPWNTRFENQNISRYSRYPLRSFLYIEPHQVRHEILLRPRDLMQWIDQKFDAWEPLTAKRREQLQYATIAYLKNKNPTTIDQRLSQPISIETVFLKADNTGYKKIPENEIIEIGSLLIGYREKFHIKELPKNVTIDWKIFTKTISSVPTLIQDPAGPFPTHVVPDFPDIQWNNYLYDYRAPNSSPVTINTPSAAIPMAVLFCFCLAIFFVLTLRAKKIEAKKKHSVLFYSIVFACAGALYYMLPGELHIPLPGTINKKELGKITEILLARLAAAYAEPQTEELNIQLSNLVNGDTYERTTSNLSQIYQPLTTSGSLGSLNSINNLKIEHAEQVLINGDKGFRIIGKWQAIIEDYSWGHMEQKPRKMRASIEIIQSENYWKVSSFTLLSMR